MEPVLLSELLNATRGTTAGQIGHDLVVRRVCSDSRTLQPGDLFWALRGEKYDGHQFVADALAQGAIACVVDRKANVSVKGPLILVDDTLRSLADFGRAYREKRESLVIGVTGSVGKTTTREMIHTVLSARHQGSRSAKNFNNEVGLPLSLLELRSDDEFGVFELGAARIGDIRALCEIAHPEVGVITKIGPAHLESFGNLDNVYRGKFELLECLPAHGFAVVGGDDEQMRKMAAKAPCNIIHVGEKPGNTIRPADIEFSPGRLKFAVDRKTYEVPVPARHYLTAALCAFAVAREIGMDHAAISDGFRNFAGTPGRCQAETIGDWTVIDDTYNANPLSMQAACLCLRDWPAGGRKLLIAGDMLELGNDAARSHEDLGGCAAATPVHRLAAFGNHAPDLSRGALRGGMKVQDIAECRDLETLYAVLDCWLEPGDVVLVKGSRGMQMERVVQWLKGRGSKSSPAIIQPAAHRAVA